MKKLIVHIGLPKTGTSSLRDFFRLNAHYLNEKKIFLPLLDNIQLKDAFLQDAALSKRSFRPSHYSSWEDKVSASKNNYERLVDFAENLNDDDILILSSEFFAGKKTDIPKLKKYADDFFDDVRVIVYLREQGSWAVSSASTRALNGKGISLLRPGEMAHMDYKYLLSKWSASFSKEQLIVRRYGKNYLKNQDTIADFIDSLDLPLECKKIKRQSDARVSESATAIKYLFCLNYLLRQGDIELDEPKRRKYARQICELNRDGSVLTLSRELADSYRAFYSSSNEWVVRNFCNDELSELFHPFKVKSSNSNKVLDENNLLVDLEMINQVLSYLKSLN
uniref:hypothetical protein n=1 Tax=Synechococcus sp. UW106 TaxID=368495 RepID=UPI000E0F0528|nr:hypothetical protein [Synechococcus sp. UW106]